MSLGLLCETPLQRQETEDQAGAVTFQGRTWRPDLPALLAEMPLSPVPTHARCTRNSLKASGVPMIRSHSRRRRSCLRTRPRNGNVGAGGLSQPQPLCRPPPCPHCPWEDTRGSHVRCSSAPCWTPGVMPPGRPSPAPLPAPAVL